MIVQFLGLLDLFAGFWLLLLTFDIGMSLGLVLGFYLLIKGIVFASDIVSFMDILAGLSILLAAYGYTFPFTWIFVLWLLQKGFFSFFSS